MSCKHIDITGEQDRGALMDLISEKAQICSEDGIEMSEFFAKLDCRGSFPRFF